MVGLHERVRRLSLNLDGVIDVTVLRTTRLSQVRVLAIFGTSAFKSCRLSEFQHLQVLTVEFPVVLAKQKLVLLDLRGICRLFQLRYLKAFASFLVLPEKIQGLQQLETVDLRALANKSIGVQLPSDVVHLPRLLHLTIPCWTRFPGGFRNMAMLRTLRHFDLSWNSIDNIRDPGRLTSLRDLRIAYQQL